MIMKRNETLKRLCECAMLVALATVLSFVKLYEAPLGGAVTLFSMVPILMCGFVYGVKAGFDLEMLQAVCDAVNVPVIASGGAGCIEDFTTLFKKIPTVSAGLAASIFHFGEVEIGDLKRELARNGIPVRL